MRCSSDSASSDGSRRGSACRRSPFYLIGGLCFGNGGFIQLGDIGAFSHIASEIGVVLLLLLLGLEYTANELISGLRRSRMAGLLDLALNAVPGAAIALILGLGPIGAFVLAGVTYISSSRISRWPSTSRSSLRSWRA